MAKWSSFHNRVFDNRDKLPIISLKLAPWLVQRRVALAMEWNGQFEDKKEI